MRHGRHEWRQLRIAGGAGAAAPAPRGGHCVVYSVALGGLLLHGGCDREHCFDDAWLLEVAATLPLRYRYITVTFTVTVPLH